MKILELISRIDFIRSLVVLSIGTIGIGNVAWQLRKKGWRDGYTRKINHFVISLVSILVISPLPDSILIPTSIFTSLGVIFIYIYSSFSENEKISAIIDSNVRDRDHPHGKFFVFLPLITGQIALYSALLYISPVFTKIAFCSMGLGDGLAEPIGLKYGKNQYRIFDLFTGQYHNKSYQGSAVVFAVSILACIFFLSNTELRIAVLISISLLYAVTITVIEAISPRGMDNFLIISVGVLFLKFFFGVTT